jgi:hypothetical protein
MWAAYYGNVSEVEAILKAGADVNAGADDVCTGVVMGAQFSVQWSIICWCVPLFVMWYICLLD